MARARRPIVILAVTLALALGGCGPLGGKSEEDQARDAVNQLIEARNQGEFAKACSLIASAQLAKIKRAGTSCEKRLAEVAPNGTTTTIRIEQVRVSGDRATVDATVSQNAGAGLPQTILLLKEGGDWKVAKAGF